MFLSFLDQIASQILRLKVFSFCQQQIAYMLSALYAITHPSIHHTSGSKTVEVRIMQFTPYCTVASSVLVFVG